MCRLYCIIDLDNNTIVAEGMTLAQAQETIKFYRADNPGCCFEIEHYSKL